MINVIRNDKGELVITQEPSWETGMIVVPPEEAARFFQTIVSSITVDDEVLFYLGYSEWLDQQGLIVDDDASGDSRTHEELARDYIASVVVDQEDDEKLIELIETRGDQLTEHGI